VATIAITVVIDDDHDDDDEDVHKDIAEDDN
jgi:hypothetical protein